LLLTLRCGSALYFLSIARVMLDVATHMKSLGSGLTNLLYEIERLRVEGEVDLLPTQRFCAFSILSASLFFLEPFSHDLCLFS